MWKWGWYCNVPLWLWVPRLEYLSLYLFFDPLSKKKNNLKTSAIYFQGNNSKNKNFSWNIKLELKRAPNRRVKLNHTEIRGEADCSITYIYAFIYVINIPQIQCMALLNLIKFSGWNSPYLQHIKSVNFCARVGWYAYIQGGIEIS